MIDQLSAPGLAHQAEKLSFHMHGPYNLQRETRINSHE
jgi:hypothetical protein